MLGIDDINEVLDEVEPLSGKWRRFSAKLGIPNSSLDTIESNHRDVAECLYRALVEWLKLNYDYQKHGRPSWEKLAAAVKAIDNALYERIARKHNLVL